MLVAIEGGFIVTLMEMEIANYVNSHRGKALEEMRPKHNWLKEKYMKHHSCSKNKNGVEQSECGGRKSMSILKEEKWLKRNNFRTKHKSRGKLCKLIIDSLVLQLRATPIFFSKKHITNLNMSILMYEGFFTVEK